MARATHIYIPRMSLSVRYPTDDRRQPEEKRAGREMCGILTCASAISVVTTAAGALRDIRGEITSREAREREIGRFELARDTDGGRGTA